MFDHKAYDEWQKAEHEARVSFWIVQAVGMFFICMLAPESLWIIGGFAFAWVNWKLTWKKAKQLEKQYNGENN
jgi:hypothetical protein